MLPGQRFLEDWIVRALRTWMIVGILLKVTRVRDRFDGLALVYYSTPWPVLACCFLLLAAHHYRRAKWHAMRRYVVLTAAALFTWVATSWYSAAPASAARELRLVQWNVARPQARLDGCAQWLRAQDADILCVSEAEPVDSRTIDMWRERFPEYRVVEGPADMLCLVRGEVVSTVPFSLGSSSFGVLHRLRVNARAVNVLQVDLIALPRSSRALQIHKLAEIANAHPDGNLIIVGDFNTPRESAHLDALRVKFHHAFEVAGHGLAETWPAFAPALSLDQIWLGAAWRPLTCRQGWTWRSDHRPVVIDLGPPDR